MAISPKTQKMFRKIFASGIVSLDEGLGESWRAVSMIREQTFRTAFQIFTISETARFKSERNYGKQLVAKLLEIFLDSENL